MRAANHMELRPLLLFGFLLLTLCAIPGANLLAQGAGVGELAVVTAEVTAIDKKTRMITLKGEEGNEVTLDVGEQVANFDQIKVGDTVSVSYYESIAIALGEPGAAPGVEAEEVAGRADEGQLPAGMVAQQITVSASVLAIDKKSRTVTLGLEDGSEAERKVDKSVAAFDELQVGDTIQVTLTRALAVKVDRVQQ